MRNSRIRILNSCKYLTSFLEENEHFYVGVMFDDYLKADLEKYGLPRSFREGQTSLPTANGSATKANIKGKFVRKQPEEKEAKTVHIRYRRKDNTLVEFDRTFHVYAKELLHKLEMPFEFHGNVHGHKIVTSGKLKFETDLRINQINTQVINIFCEIFNEFDIFSESFEPAIHFNKRFDLELLPQGKLTPENVEEVLQISKRYTRGENEQFKAFKERLDILMGFDPDLRGTGPKNFFGYLVFGFSDLGIVVLETMYSGNATYVFKMEDYDQNIIKDKQQVLASRQFLKRFFHYDNWPKNVATYLQSLKHEVE